MNAAPVLLVPGPWMGGWAWGFVQAHLDERGVASTAIDLPSSGAARSTMADDADAIGAALEELDGPAVLVGHSYAGVPITEAAAGNDRVAHLVYVCAVLPGEDESTGSVMATDPHPSRIGEAIVATEDGRARLDPAGAREILFNDVSAETAAPVIAALGTHRLSTFGESPTTLGWKEHASTYIITQRDLLFSHGLQHRMAANATAVIQVDAGHMPLLSQPAALADAIAAAATA